MKFYHKQMKSFKFQNLFIAFSFLCILSISINAQVTIGSNITPLDGTLLDLKEHEPDINNATSTRGLLLPRVELKKSDELILGDVVINDSDEGGNQKLIHSGLVVYNTSELNDFCPGIYIWSGSEWIPLHKCSSSSITIDNVGPYYIASGQDLQDLENINLNVNWDGTSSLVFNNVATLYDKVEFEAVNLSTITSPASITLTPKKMSQTEVSDNGGNPFKTKESNVYFTISEGGDVQKSKSVLVNQTNKAITLDGKTASIQLVYLGDTNSKDEFTVNVGSNTKWIVKSKVPDDDTNVISSIAINDQIVSTLPSESFGSDRFDNNADIIPLSYTVFNPSKTVAYSKLVLSDASETPRYNDIEISVYQCNNLSNTQQQTMVEWTDLTGFSNVMDKDSWLTLYNQDPTAAKKADIQSNIDTPMPISGIAWHRDQDGNIFLSASFDTNNTQSNTQRWMITNLSATTYDPIRDDGTVAKSAPALNTAASITDARMAYPRTTGGSAVSPAPANDKTLYNRNPRIGLLYNWAAATMGRSASTDDKNSSTLNVQGICPNGWHLPTYLEYQELLGDYSTNTSGIIPNNYSVYSRLEDSALLRENGKAIKEACQEFNTAGQGQSNPINTTERAGFNLLLSGYVIEGSIAMYNSIGSLWTANSGSPRSGQNTGYYVYAWKSNTYVNYSTYDRGLMSSVRCKKNTP